MLGGHNHIVLNPPQEIRDCSRGPEATRATCGPRSEDRRTIDDGCLRRTTSSHPRSGEPPVRRSSVRARPRERDHSRTPARSRSTSAASISSSRTTREAVSRRRPGHVRRRSTASRSSRAEYKAFPINDQVPEDPRRRRDARSRTRRSSTSLANLDLLVGYAPTARGASPRSGGDSPLGNLVGDAIWLRLGIQTDFSLTNSTGIRTDLVPGPITVEQMFNIFPFDNSITKMQLSGVEVQELFDFVARRSAGRGCSSQIQIAGARVRLNCTGCTRPGSRPACTTDDDCPIKDPGSCDLVAGLCNVTACADNVYIGFRRTSQEVPEGRSVLQPSRCNSDQDCLDKDGAAQPGACAKTRRAGRLCLSPIAPTNLYELATSNYLAGGGSGLPRAPAQHDAVRHEDPAARRAHRLHPRRQAVRLRRRTPDTKDGLKACGNDADCAPATSSAPAPGPPRTSLVGGVLTCTPTAECDPARVAACARTAATRSRSSTTSGAPRRRSPRAATISTRAPSAVRAASSSRASTTRAAPRRTTASRCWGDEDEGSLPPSPPRRRRRPRRASAPRSPPAAPASGAWARGRASSSCAPRRRGRPGPTPAHHVLQRPQYPYRIEAKNRDGSPNDAFEGVGPHLRQARRHRSLAGPTANGRNVRLSGGAAEVTVEIAAAFGDTCVWAEDLGYEPSTARRPGRSPVRERHRRRRRRPHRLPGGPRLLLPRRRHRVRRHLRHRHQRSDLLHRAAHRRRPRRRRALRAARPLSPPSRCASTPAGARRRAASPSTWSSRASPPTAST